MTRYAIDRARDALVAVWSTGIGDIAIVVTDDLPRDVADNDLLRLAARLTDLSQVCWRCYTHPADAADDHGPGSVGAQRQQERDAFAMILPTITAARPADGPPSTTVEHAAHAVRRALQVIDEPALAMPILADVDAELAAVEQAERGDLTERAQQAVTLSREDASPLQVS
ncbi:MAG TPA: hypothetical protein VFV66_10490, partial [Nonomuraea sp.]|nr:hypothetical protein [Nonomuraea sp.]